jgi:hypothetical protein
MLSPFEIRFSIGLESVMNTRVDGSILGIRGQAGGFGHGITNGSLGFSKSRINRGLVSQDERLNELVVKQQGPRLIRLLEKPRLPLVMPCPKPPAWPRMPRMLPSTRVFITDSSPIEKRISNGESMCKSIM